MTPNTLPSRLLAWLLGATVLAGIAWFGSSIAHSPARRHSTADSSPTEDLPATPNETDRAPATPPSKATVAPKAVAPQPSPHQDEQAFLDAHYPNQVTAEAKPSDSPQQVEQKVRQLDPQYAKLLDQNRAAEALAAQQVIDTARAAEAQRRLNLTDDER